MNRFQKMSPKEFRQLVRTGQYSEYTTGCCSGYVQANLVILPKEFADDFRKFAERNPKPCPILEVGGPGDPYTKLIADRACITTDIPKYRVFRYGQQVDECTDISAYWQDDFVWFLTGCSYTFESALIKNGIEIRNITDGHMTSTYKTNIPCAPGGRFSGNMVVTMRPVPAEQVDLAYEVTGRFPHVHGAPIYHGDPAKIGIDLSKPDWGGVTRIEKGEVPLFWACGVTPQVALENAKLPIVITHTPGAMFVSDIPDADIEETVFGYKG